MNFLKSAVLVGVFSLVGFSCPADEEVFDFERLKTVHGRTYQKIFVLTADAHGLMFRHEDGIAKLSFDELPMNLRMLYEPADSQPEVVPVAEIPEEAGEQSPTTVVSPVYLTYVIRPVYRITQAMPNGWGGPAQYWPGHWPRYHPAHAFAHAPCRDLVVRDFLYTTGLAWRPRGVVRRFLPYNRGYLAHHRF